MSTHTRLHTATLSYSCTHVYTHISEHMPYTCLHTCLYAHACTIDGYRLFKYIHRYSHMPECRSVHVPILVPLHSYVFASMAVAFFKNVPMWRSSSMDMVTNFSNPIRAMLVMFSIMYGHPLCNAPAPAPHRFCIGSASALLPMACPGHMYRSAGDFNAWMRVYRSMYRGPYT